jgi:germination protein M
VLDFSRELQTLHTGGTTGEILTVYSIVNTLTMNFKEVERVQILIDGDEVETLVGHLDLEQPFTRDNRWIRPSALTGA